MGRKQVSGLEEAQCTPWNISHLWQLEAAGCICLRKPLDLNKHENASLSTGMCSEGTTRGGLGPVLSNRLSQTMRWAVLALQHPQFDKLLSVTAVPAPALQMDLDTNAGELVMRGEGMQKRSSPLIPTVQ